MRSRSAAAQLLEAGFRDVHSMAGGIKAWDGMVAEGEFEAGMPWFDRAATDEELVALAWALEEGSRRYYREVMGWFGKDQEAERLFGDLVNAEAHHKQSLVDAFLRTAGRRPDFDGLRDRLGDLLDGAFMEGGVRVAEALEWSRGKGTAGILEVAMALEVNAYDLYIKMSRRVAARQAGAAFTALAHEEQEHLARLSDLLDARL